MHKDLSMERLLVLVHCPRVHSSVFTGLSVPPQQDPTIKVNAMHTPC